MQHTANANLLSRSDLLMHFADCLFGSYDVDEALTCNKRHESDKLLVVETVLVHFEFGQIWIYHG